MVAASIRSNNPGAMWGKGNRIAAKWGSTGTQDLADGLGQGNNIAFFPTKIQGACAQFDLWRTGYCNRTLRQAILRWSGGNWSQPYADFLVKQTGIGLETVVTPALLASPSGLKLMKFQAQWEAGIPYPMSDAEWLQAQKKVFSGVSPVTKKNSAGGAVVVVAGGAATVAAKSGVPWGVVLLIVLLGVVVAATIWFLIHLHHEDSTTPPTPSAPPPLPKG